MPVGRVSRNTGRRGRDDSRRPARARRGTSPRPTGAKRSRSASGSTGGAFKLSSTPRAAVLALVVCAMALSVAVPLRTYWSQRTELGAQQERRAQLEREVQSLQQRKEELSDPAQVEAEARERLGYVRPGETPYMVHVPPAEATADSDGSAAEHEDVPWYEQLWKSVRGEDGS
ncbi:FtsB family cell division protein [Bounagaea algeriensis]